MKIEINPAELIAIKRIARGKCADLECDECSITDYCTESMSLQSRIDIARSILILGDINEEI